MAHYCKQDMDMQNKFLCMVTLVSLFTAACQLLPASTTLDPSSAILQTSSPAPQFVTETPQIIATPQPLVPNFSHILLIVFEKSEYETVVDTAYMPYFNLLANSFTLLNQHYATTHPGLPNYISMMGGDTFGITDECELADCSINAPSLADLIEESGRTWKTYQDDMPQPCYFSDTLRYVRRHNPFVFFEPIRLNPERCNRTVVPMTQLDVDIAANAIPNFVFITPDICYSTHECTMELADGWLKETVEKLYPVLNATGEPYLIIVTWDEGQSDGSCCGLPEKAGGRVPTLLVSPQVKSNFLDVTPYSHYSILKTISAAWGLPYLGHAADADTNLIVNPWK
jgi:phosphatidylinositol-3-phosphatase